MTAGSRSARHRRQGIHRRRGHQRDGLTGPGQLAYAQYGWPVFPCQPGPEEPGHPARLPRRHHRPRPDQPGGSPATPAGTWPSPPAPLAPTSWTSTPAAPPATGSPPWPGSARPGCSTAPPPASGPRRRAAPVLRRLRPAHRPPAHQPHRLPRPRRLRPPPALPGQHQAPAAPPCVSPHRRKVLSDSAGLSIKNLTLSGNPRYTGRQVWNRQPSQAVLVDPADTGLGHKQVQRWNLPEGWVISRHPAHTALVSEADFIAAQDTSAPRGPAGQAARRYLLAGLLACGRCGRKLESAWSHGRPAYRCRHGYTSATVPIPPGRRPPTSARTRSCRTWRPRHPPRRQRDPGPPTPGRHHRPGPDRGPHRPAARRRRRPYLRPARPDPARRRSRPAVRHRRQEPLTAEPRKGGPNRREKEKGTRCGRRLSAGDD